MTNTLPKEKDETPRNTLGDVKAEELVDTPSESLALLELEKDCDKLDNVRGKTLSGLLAITLPEGEVTTLCETLTNVEAKALTDILPYSLA